MDTCSNVVATPSVCKSRLQKIFRCVRVCESSTMKNIKNAKPCCNQVERNACSVKPSRCAIDTAYTCLLLRLTPLNSVLIAMIEWERGGDDDTSLNLLLLSHVDLQQCPGAATHLGGQRYLKWNMLLFRCWLVFVE